MRRFVLDSDLGCRPQQSLKRAIDVIALEIAHAVRIDAPQAGPHQHVRGIGGLIVRIADTCKYLLDKPPQGIRGNTTSVHAVAYSGISITILRHSSPRVRCSS